MRCALNVLSRDHELEAAFESQAERLRLRDGKAQTYKEFICQVYVRISSPGCHGTDLSLIGTSPYCPSLRVQ